jgi:tetratricopeptide (TPR) repeat protein
MFGVQLRRTRLNLKAHGLMNDVRGKLLVLFFFISTFLSVPLLAAQETPSATVEDQAKKIVDLINRIRVITKENDRLKKMVETYESELEGLDEQNKKTSETLKELQDTITKNSSCADEGEMARISKELADTHYNLGVIYQSQSQYDQAELEYKKVLAIKPDDADAIYNLAVIYDSYKTDPASAVYYYKKYLDLNPRAADSDQISRRIDKLLP